MESCITNRLNSLCVLYCNLEKRFGDYLSKNEMDSIIKGELEKIKEELQLFKKETNLFENREEKNLEKIKQDIIYNNKYIIKEELNSIKNTINSITHELQYQKNININTQNYLEYTLLYADFENCGICMYCPSEPYEPDNNISSGPIIDNEKYTILKNILNN